MIYVSRSPRIALLGLALSAAIFLVMYLTVIKPSSDTSNAAVRSAEQQTQQLVRSVDKQTNGAVPAAAKRSTDCIAAAGTDTAKLQACATR